MQQSPKVYDGVQHALPYQLLAGETHTFKTVIDRYVDSNGSSTEGVLFAHGTGDNYFAGSVGKGTGKPKEKLSFNGKIRTMKSR